MLPNKRVSVLDANMAYIDVGEGDPVVFLHGNPTSSYLWRNIIPYMSGTARCLAPDLIGMGASDKLEGSQYRFVDHARYLDAWFEAVGLSENVVIVVHDWGSALGFDWAHRHPDRIKGIVHFESITAPASTDIASEGAKWFYSFMRSEEGERAVIDDNMFIEKVMLESLGDRLNDEDKAVYREPWLQGGEARRPLITWPREIPVDGEPEDVTKIVTDYQAWMETNDIPKLFLLGTPAAIMTPGEGRLEAARLWSNQTEVAIPGDPDAPPAANHYIQEVCPDIIGSAIAEWYAELS
ncbi:MAG: haloalkane dehalogenase [Rhodospirillaceae bacterium]|jgi:haloalkane dehalogenase|nr:haloalkane dehalogenase [Rhodospirillaceae bacterium]MBT5564447.1 haloalkane dehalogenase [Rhodospirillaceae bacterium]MBT6089738.1 haloalkane dehalogenase [Rhodospirillaceae bacterium]